MVGIGRIGVAISGLGPNLPLPQAHSSELATVAATPAPGIAVALRAAHQLGCQARAVGYVGDDLLGQLARSAMAAAGIETEHLRPSGTSACELAIIAGDGTTRARANGERGDAIAFDYEPALAGAAALLIDGSEPGEQRRAAQLARDRKLPVIFDVAELRKGVDGLIAYADVLLVSEREASELAPRGELTDALADLMHHGPRAVVITLGSEGAIGRHGDQIVECPAFAADALDTSGAGSVFHGAFAAALLSGLAFHRCMELAAAAAALTVSELGPWHAMPTRDDVLALLRTRRERSAG